MWETEWSGAYSFVRFPIFIIRYTDCNENKFVILVQLNDKIVRRLIAKKSIVV